MCTTVVTRTLIIENPQGLHARPAQLLAKKAMQYQSQIELIRDQERIDAKSVLHILTLGVNAGGELILEARGPDAQQAVEALIALVKNNFEEKQSSTERRDS